MQIPDTLYELNGKTRDATFADVFLMQTFCQQEYLDKSLNSVTNAMQKRLEVKNYSYRYTPIQFIFLDDEQFTKDDKVYTMQDIIYLYTQVMHLGNPLELYGTKRIRDLTDSSVEIVLNETDINYMILIKLKDFYGRIFETLQKAKEYEKAAKEFSCSFRTPAWFPTDCQFSASYSGKELLTLWKYREVINRFLQSA